MPGVIVVGMHRGGTSAIAGVLHHLGVYMGDDLLPPSEHNPKGYFEDRKIVKMHDRLMGGDWRDPKTLPEEELERLMPEHIALLTNHISKKELWGIKDPRLCIVWPDFLKALKFIAPNLCDTLQIFTVWRDPFEAAQSLYARGGHSLEEAIGISMRYYHSMIHLSRLTNDWYLPFRESVRQANEAVSKIAEILGVEPTQGALDFLDPDLIHWR